MTQHAVSIGVSDKHRGWDVVTYLFRQPLWLLGWVAAFGGFAFQAVALHSGQFSIVQPLLVTELVFVLVVRRFWVHQHIAKMAWTAALITCAALAVFLSVAQPHGGHLRPDPADWLSALAVFGGAVAVVGGHGALGLSDAPGGALRYGSLDHLGPDGSLHQVDHRRARISGPLRHAGALARLRLDRLRTLGSVLQQAALQTGPLSVSQPLIVVVDPAVAVVLSVWIFDERFTVGVAQKAIAGVAFCVMAVGVTILSRTAPNDLEPSMSVRL